MKQTMVGIAGVGRLGSAVAERLLQQGMSVGVWNRSADKLAPLVAKGAKAFATPAELAAASDCVLTLLTDLDALKAVYFGPSGLVEAGVPRMFVEMSTLPPAAHQDMAAKVRGAGSAYLECPVAGSRDAALSGQLMALAGGKAEDLARVRPVLDALCRRIEHVGDIGSAASVKLAINLPLIVYFEVLSEALRLVDHLALDPHLMVSLLAESTGGPSLLRLRGSAIADALQGAALPPAMATVATFTKDLRIMLDEARARGLRLPATDVALAEYSRVEAAQAGDIDGMRLPALLVQAARSATRS